MFDSSHDLVLSVNELVNAGLENLGGGACPLKGSDDVFNIV